MKFYLRSVERLFAGSNYLKYRLSAGSLHDVHSPFVYELLETVIQDRSAYYIFDQVESLRSKALLDTTEIEVQDYGTGGAHQQTRKLKIRYIASHFAKPKKYGQLLFRLVNHFKPVEILEIGTSLGFTTLYLAAPSSSSRVITLEGCPQTAARAKLNFKTLRANNIETIVGEFSRTIPAALDHFSKLGLVYFDGNHRMDATLDYFQLCLAKHDENSVFVFDDIHYSRGMERAWNVIREHPDAGLTIDLFQLGLVFFKTSMPKQHFTLRF